MQFKKSKKNTNKPYFDRESQSLGSRTEETYPMLTEKIVT